MQINKCYLQGSVCLNNYWPIQGDTIDICIYTCMHINLLYMYSHKCLQKHTHITIHLYAPSSKFDEAVSAQHCSNRHLAHHSIMLSFPLDLTSRQIILKIIFIFSKKCVQHCSITGTSTLFNHALVVQFFFLFLTFYSFFHSWCEKKKKT